MKKLVYLAVVAFAASMVACGGSDKAANAENDAVVEGAAVIETVDSCAGCQCDSCTCDSCTCGTCCDTTVVATAVVTEGE